MKFKQNQPPAFPGPYSSVPKPMILFSEFSFINAIIWYFILKASQTKILAAIKVVHTQTRAIRLYDYKRMNITQ